MSRRVKARAIFEVLVYYSGWRVSEKEKDSLLLSLIIITCIQ